MRIRSFLAKALTMGRLSSRRSSIFMGLSLLAVWIVSRGDSLPGPPSSRAFREFPRVTFWAWERREDLRRLDPSRHAVAYLDQTIFIDQKVSSRPRLHPLLVASEVQVIAVVRIEAPWQHARLEQEATVTNVADLMERSFRRERITAFQIDFDAAESQRGFYSKLIRETRRRMPAGMPLSITALASWCGKESWLTDLPVDEAVPMFFRMGRDAPMINGSGWSYPIREPLCAGSAGVSTDEPSPRVSRSQRVYIFHPSSWTSVALANAERMIAP